MPPPSDTQLDWAAHQDTIRDLYWKQAKELPEVMQTMEDVHGFAATKKMYKKHIKAWGFEKNIKTAEMIAMIKIRELRRSKNKETLFIRRGRPVEPGKLRRFAKRHKLAEQGTAGTMSDQQVATPPDITYTTPEPDHMSGSLLPVARPFVSQEVDDGDESTSRESSEETHGFDACGSPSSGAILWPTLLLESTPDRSYTTSQSPPSLPVMSNPFISSAFSRQEPEMPDISHHFLHNDANVTFPQAAWLERPEDAGCHGYQASGNGAPSWIFLSPTPQQHRAPPLAYGSDREIPLFQSGYSSAMLGISNGFSVTSPAHATNAGISALDHTALHNAVINNNFSLAKTLLGGGANVNCAARGGMTPLHYAAYQRNLELVKLLRDHGASLDAVTDKGRSILFFAVRSHARAGSSDMQPYAHQNGIGHGPHTDEATLRVVDALYNFPAGWGRLRRSLEQADKDGVTPLMVAAEGGFTETVVMFLQRGALPDVRDHASHTALKYAARANQRHLVRILLEVDDGVEARDLSHLLKLASRNFTAENPVYGMDGWWDTSHVFDSGLVAEEIVRLCRERGVLDGLLRLAEQKRKTGVAELLQGAMARLGLHLQEQGPRSASGS